MVPNRSAGRETSDFRIGPQVALDEFEWEFGISGEEVASGDRSLRIWNEGDYDDGVTWGVHPVSVEPGSAYDVTVTAQFWSESESFNTLRDAVMRLGPEPPEVEEDFPQPGGNTTDLGETPYGGSTPSTGQRPDSRLTPSTSPLVTPSSGKVTRPTTSTT